MENKNKNMKKHETTLTHTHTKQMCLQREKGRSEERK